jgi:hypothetical protein
MRLQQHITSTNPSSTISCLNLENFKLETECAIPAPPQTFGNYTLSRVGNCLYVIGTINCNFDLGPGVELELSSEDFLQMMNVCMLDLNPCCDTNGALPALQWQMLPFDYEFVRNGLQPKQFHSATVIGTRIYLIDGSLPDESCTADILYCDTITCTFSKVELSADSDSFVPRSGHSAVSPDQQSIYVFGGRSKYPHAVNGMAYRHLNDLWVFDTVCSRWKMLHDSTTEDISKYYTDFEPFEDFQRMMNLPHPNRPYPVEFLQEIYTSMIMSSAYIPELDASSSNEEE